MEPENGPGLEHERSLQIATAASTPTGSYDLTITGTGTIRASAVSRSTAATLNVQQTQDFGIAGNLGTLRTGEPGAARPDVDESVRLQPEDHEPRGLARGDEQPRLQRGQNFAVTQVPAARYPITLPAGQTRTLGQLGIADADKPQVEMLNQPWNQDACKNAAINLDYTGSASK